MFPDTTKFAVKLAEAIVGLQMMLFCKADWVEKSLKNEYFDYIFQIYIGAAPVLPKYIHLLNLLDPFRCRCVHQTTIQPHFEDHILFQIFPSRNKKNYTIIKL